MDSSIESDLVRLALQEEQLQFETFNADTAWQLGTLLKEAVEARSKAVVIDIQLFCLWPTTVFLRHARHYPRQY